MCSALYYPINFVVKEPRCSLALKHCPKAVEQTDLRQPASGSVSQSKSRHSTGNSESGCGGAERDRTVDPLLAKQVLSQLSYSPRVTGTTAELVGLGRFELPTSPLSGVRSNQLSYRPKLGLALLGDLSARCLRRQANPIAPNSILIQIGFEDKVKRASRLRQK